jgi:transposase
VGSGGAGSGSELHPPTRPNRRPAIQSSRASTISSWERPTKFHHITRGSSNGSPPSRNTRAPAIRQLRDLTRYRVDLLAARTAEKQRVEKLLEDALIKLSVVASDPFGVSGRAMMAALIAGERDPGVLAELARGSLRSKTARLTEALTGRFTDHHAFLLTQMLHRVDAITADIATVQARVEGQLGELAPAVGRLDAIPGIGPVAAQMILAEIGLDMTRFPTPAHLASWARFAPGVSESARRKKGHSGTGHGNPYLARVLGQAAVSAGRTDTFFGERYRRIARSTHRRSWPRRPSRTGS